MVGKRNEPLRLLRHANRVPLLYQQSACAITKAVAHFNWKAYGSSQPRGAYPEVEKELRLALQKIGWH